MSDTSLDFLEIHISSKHFVSLQDVLKTCFEKVLKTFEDILKTSSRHFCKMSWRHVFKMCSRHVLKTSTRHVFKTSSRPLPHNNFSSSKTSWRRLQDVMEDLKLLCSIRVEDVFKTDKCLLGRVVRKIQFYSFFKMEMLLEFQNEINIRIIG